VHGYEAGVHAAIPAQAALGRVVVQRDPGIVEKPRQPRPEPEHVRRAKPLRQGGLGHAEIPREAPDCPTPPDANSDERDGGAPERIGIPDLAGVLASGELAGFGSETADLFVHRCTSLSWWCNDALPGGSATRRESRGGTFGQPLRRLVES
jgi:hypothetical protein